MEQECYGRAQRRPQTVLCLDLHQSAVLVVRFGSLADIQARTAQRD